MSVYFAVDLPVLASHVHYLPELATADIAVEVALAIERHHATVEEPRPQRSLPH